MAHCARLPGPGEPRNGRKVQVNVRASMLFPAVRDGAADAGRKGWYFARAVRTGREKRAKEKKKSAS